MGDGFLFLLFTVALPVCDGGTGIGRFVRGCRVSGTRGLIACEGKGIGKVTLKERRDEKGGGGKVGWDGVCREPSPLPLLFASVST